MLKTSFKFNLTKFKTKVLRQPIKLWYFKEEMFTNFGDELSVDIIEGLFKRKVVRSPIEDAYMFAVGSIIEQADRERTRVSYVWGSGFIQEGIDIGDRNLIFTAVRGEMTRSRLPSEFRNIPIGDPGLLVNLIYPYIRDVDSEMVGIVPHYTDENNEILERAKSCPGKYKIISVKNSPEEVARQITSCGLILSSSLHGLIVADSYNIPNIHLKLSNNLVGGEYKFRDYYTATGRAYRFTMPDSIYNIQDIDRIIKEYRSVENLSEIQKGLINSFPL